MKELLEFVTSGLWVFIGSMFFIAIVGEVIIRLAIAIRSGK